MKKTIYFFLFLVTLMIGCKKSDSNPSNPDNGIGGDGSVNFQAKAVNEDGQYFVKFIPDKNIVLSRVIITLPAQNIKDTVSGDNQTVFDTQSGFKIGPSPVQLAIGQAWVFTVQGKVGSSTGQSFSATVNLNITAIEGENAGGNVNFTVSVVQDQQQQQFFQFKPDKNVLVTQIVVKCQALNVNQTIPNNSGQVFNDGNPLWLGPVGGLASGQQWEFNLTGTLESATGTPYNETVNYTIP